MNYIYIIFWLILLSIAAKLYYNLLNKNRLTKEEIEELLKPKKISEFQIIDKLSDDEIDFIIRNKDINFLPEEFK